MSGGEAAGPVFVLLVTGKLKPGHMAQFVENFQPLAKYVQDQEPGCLTYKLCTGSDDVNRLCIYERYVSQEYLEAVHWKSEAFQQFGAKNRADGIEWEFKESIKYYETEVGHMAR